MLKYEHILSDVMAGKGDLVIRGMRRLPFMKLRTMAFEEDVMINNQ